MTTEIIPGKPKKGGPGRPPGRKNDLTLRREEKFRRELEQELAAQGDDIDSMRAIDVLRRSMRIFWRSGDLPAACRIASELLNFEEPRVSASDHVQPLPQDLLPDEPACPDEPGPDDVAPD